MKKNPTLNQKQVNTYLFYVVMAAILLGQVIVGIIFLPGRAMETWQQLQLASQKNDDVTKLQNMVELLLSTSTETLDLQTNKAAAALPDEKKTTGIVIGVSKLASGSGTVVKSLEFSPGLISTASAQTGFLKTDSSGEVVVGGGVKAVPAVMEVSGPLSAVANFLETIEKSSQILGVTRVDFGAGSEKKSTRIAFLIYYQPKREKIPEAGQFKFPTQAEIELVEGLPPDDIFKLQTN